MADLIALDLFCGAGGLSIGLGDAGFDVRVGADYDRDALATYQRNLGHRAVSSSITKISPADLLSEAGIVPGECILLAGGPPCQGFSIQRRGPREDDRNPLILEFLRFIEGIRPKFFLIENVGGLLSKHGQPYLDVLVERTSSLGYFPHLQKLDAVHYGVPQFRNRTLFVGELTEGQSPQFQFPSPERDATQWRTVRNAIGDLPSPPLDGSPHPDLPNHYREGNLSPINRERLRHIPEGGGREHLPPHLTLPCHVNNPKHRHLDVYGRLAWDRPAGTITARFDSFTRGRFGHPQEDRTITLREGARLQTFPDTFGFVGSRESCARQIGNAVPPRLAEVLGRAIRASLSGASGAAIGRRTASRSIQQALAL